MDNEELGRYSIECQMCGEWFYPLSLDIDICDDCFDDMEVDYDNEEELYE
ncbi:hypothetical protein [Methanobrevibacter sp.]